MSGGTFMKEIGGIENGGELSEPESVEGQYRLHDDDIHNFQ
jgi:hypothetical protein